MCDWKLVLVHMGGPTVNGDFSINVVENAVTSTTTCFLSISYGKQDHDAINTSTASQAAKMLIDISKPVPKYINNFLHCVITGYNNIISTNTELFAR